MNYLCFDWVMRLMPHEAAPCTYAAKRAISPPLTYSSQSGFKGRSQYVPAVLWQMEDLPMEKCRLNTSIEDDEDYDGDGKKLQFLTQRIGAYTDLLSGHPRSSETANVCIYYRWLKDEATSQLKQRQHFNYIHGRRQNFNAGIKTEGLRGVKP